MDYNCFTYHKKENGQFFCNLCQCEVAVITKHEKSSNHKLKMREIEEADREQFLLECFCRYCRSELFDP